MGRLEAALRRPTRAEWLRLAIRDLRPLFDGLEARPNSKTVVRAEQVEGSKDNEIGWCWTFDGHSFIGVSPEACDGTEVLAILLHELIHSAVGPMTGHNGAFRRVWRQVGFEGLPTEVSCSEELAAVLQSIARRLGPYPTR